MMIMVMMIAASLIWILEIFSILLLLRKIESTIDIISRLVVLTAFILRKHIQS